MPISAGERIGPFVIRAPLGKGGMGEVYLAFDPRLGREVAIKVLLAGAAGKPERRARFVQEAKLASALNHPNIVTIYDVDTAEVDGKLVDFVAMQYVPGKTLDKLIGRKGLRFNEALRYAEQVADGLGAAHRAGIIHRDLKPANIIVTEAGEVKILDFGLAKLIEREEADAWAQTQSVHLETAPGIIAGTAAYMSPEQAEGQPVDERSDIFSFGAVLYEMITGGRAFNGASQLSTLASVLHASPTPMREARSAVPREMEQIVQRCLRKDPARRWQNVADLKLALEDLSQDLDAGAMGAGEDEGAHARTAEARTAHARTTHARTAEARTAHARTAHARTAEARTNDPRWPLFLWLPLVVIALAGGVYLGARSLARPQPTFQRLTFRRGNIAGARFAPDGTILFSAQWATDPIGTFSMRPGRSEFRPLDLNNTSLLSISSSGELAILLDSPARGAPGTLARVPLSGGAPRQILKNVNDADWAPDGSNLAVSRTIGGRNRIEYPIGTVLNESEGIPPLSLRVSPHGDLLAYFEFDSAAADFAVTVLDTHGRKRVLSRGWKGEDGLGWSPKGDEVWYSGNKTGGEPALHAVKLNGDDRVVVETPARLTLEDITREGRVLAAVEDSRIGIWGLAPGAAQERDLSWFDASRVYDISADGKTILFVELTYGQSRNPAVYLRNTDGSPAVRLGDGSRPALSPDGKWVACIVSDGSRTALTLLPVGAGVARTIGASGLHYERVEWFPDSERLLFEGNEPNRPARTFVQNVSGGTPAPLTREGMFAGRVSPSEEYATVVAGGKLSLLPMRGGDPKLIASLEPGESVIRWSADGRFLFLRQPNGPSALKINRLDVVTGRRELWKELRTPDAVGVQIGQVAITPSGSAYAYSYQRDLSTLYLVEGLR